tara:strand:+ start:72 stop:428 length:357 start_codon:yes stop_codon:yes gene_type:complete
MELNIFLKEEHLEFLKQIETEFSINGIEKTIHILIEEIIKNYDSKIVFDEIRCVGGCLSNDEFVKVKLDDSLISKMRDIFKQYDFEDYDTEEQELSKVVRCIVNFADQECDMNDVISV